MSIAWLLVFAAFAQDPAPEIEAQSEPGTEDTVSIATIEGRATVVIHGQRAEDVARGQVMQELADEGYTTLKNKGNYTLMRNIDPWKGQVRVYKDGWVAIERQPVRIEGPNLPKAKAGSPGSWALCLLNPFACIKTGGVLVGRNKFQSQKARTLEAIGPSVAIWGDRVADARVDARIQGLPDQLQALWDDGTSLASDTDSTIPPGQPRKDAVLFYWNTRTDTVWGDRVRLVVEGFIRNVVQDSATPYTAEEVRDFNLTRYCERELDLTSPWEVVSRTVE